MPTEAVPTPNPATPHGAGGDEYQVVARRYRPQSFDALVGQEHVARALKQAITSGRIGHAYLFTGARGVGKTSAARILAKALNCTGPRPDGSAGDGPTPEPCGECDVCLSVASGDDVDVLEIDGASNRGIDEIRQLRQNVGIRPSRSHFKVYIIDEVHMLTKEAFNALLKTLEEPPEHVKFIFATTEPNKIPITILSRCQRFDFAGIAAASIRQRLAQIAEAEGVQVEGEALQILAARAAGSMRDSQSLLEQLLAVADGAVTAEDVNRLLGVAPAQRIEGLARAIAVHDAAAALGELASTLEGGAEVGQLVDQLMGYFRDAMTLAVGCSPEQAINILPAQAETAGELGKSIGVANLLAVMQVLDNAAARMRISLHTRTLAEMAIVRACELEDLQELANLAAELRGDAPPAPRPSRPPAPRPPAPETVAPAPTSPQASPSPAPTPRPNVQQRTVQQPSQQQNSAPPAVAPPAASAAPASAAPPPAAEPPARAESANAAPEGLAAQFAQLSSRAPRQAAPAAAAQGSPQAAAGGEQAPAAEASAADAATPEPAGVAPPPPDSPIDNNLAATLWRQASEAVGGLAATFASSASRVEVGAGDRWTVVFSDAMSKEQCEQPARRTELNTALARSAGRKIELTLQIDPTAAPPPEPAARVSPREKRAQVAEQPFVRRALELFESEPERLRYTPPKGE
ncbi:DNA polymerase III subunit tau [Pseudobythopirellula maris]|uniref:DNA polymerase III subunit gamma/tau n=1 Tax=Pseudobythopirellula maris TaxID=2527991 RepID=A0A5C5ZPB4_9BACT|nr:DNA polymerase III subunit gamma/tau [Pseudobythopirellula maris]TWT88955.1 DNA polymerase III subunit tau [Pseudobythopirellula maris]